MTELAAIGRAVLYVLAAIGALAVVGLTLVVGVVREWNRSPWERRT